MALAGEEGLSVWRLLLGLGLLAAAVGPAWADIAGGPASPLEVGKQYDSGSWTTFWYVPDPTNAVCPAGQWDLHVVQGAVQEDDANGSSSYDTCTSNPMSSMGVWWWIGVEPVGGVFRCPSGSELYLGNCVGTDMAALSAFDPAVAFEFFISSFGLVVVCWLVAHGAAIVLKPLRH